MSRISERLDHYTVKPMSCYLIFQQRFQCSFTWLYKDITQGFVCEVLSAAMSELIFYIRFLKMFRVKSVVTNKEYYFIVI